MIQTPFYDSCFALQCMKMEQCFPVEGFQSYTNLAGQPLHKEEGSGMVPSLELFCWNAINIRKLAFSYARFTLYGDTLTTAHGLHTRRSAR